LASERKAAAAQGRRPRIRLKGRRGGAGALKDIVRGAISFAHDYDGFVLVTDLGEPTAALIEATDDHDQGVTHVLKAGRGAPALASPRATEQLARHALICEALGWLAPCFSLVAPIRTTDRRKRSLTTLRREGWTAEALRATFLKCGGVDTGAARRSEDEAIACLDLTCLATDSALFPPPANDGAAQTGSNGQRSTSER
jgi:glutamyl/glutaminyl-tRNA synthetase